VLLRFERRPVFSNDLAPALSSFVRTRFERVSTMERRNGSLPEGGDVREQVFHGHLADRMVRCAVSRDD
jgi:hypothetical protein